MSNATATRKLRPQPDGSFDVLVGERNLGNIAPTRSGTRSTDADRWCARARNGAGDFIVGATRIYDTRTEAAIALVEGRVAR